MDRHTKPYSCKEPAYDAPKFGDKGGLWRHEREKHGKHGATRFICPEPLCPRHIKGFARKNHRDIHIRDTCSHQTYRGFADDNDHDKSMSLEEESVTVSRNLKTAEEDGLRKKLQGLENEKKELVERQAKVEENILTLKKAMELVAN